MRANRARQVTASCLGGKVPLILWLASLCLLANPACTDTSRCRAVCARETQCRERSKTELQAGQEPLRFGESDCVAACKDLERDGEGSAIVRQHAECVAQAQDCGAVLACP
jgi:hypothetical protein